MTVEQLSMLGQARRRWADGHAYERAQEIVDNCGVSAQIYRRPTKAQAAQAPDTYGFILMDILYPGVPR